MFVIVLLLGILAIAVGAAATFFGIPIKEFSFGNTLLVIGMIAIMGGLLLIAIAGGIRELRRIAEALARSPLRLPRPAESYDALAPSGVRPPMHAPRMPPPMPPMPPRNETAREDRPPTLRPETAPATEHTLKAAAASAGSAAEPPPVVDEHEAIPLSPHEPQYALPLDTPDVQTHDDQPADQPRAAESQPEPVNWREGEPPPTQTPSFDAIWPTREQPGLRGRDDVASSGAPPFDENAAAEESAQQESAPPSEQMAEAEHESAAPSPEAPPAAAVGPEAPADEPPHPVSILKSGVVDGMAYTLYSDGSIEAELPSGTIRFASINELRMHLERTD